MMDMSRNRMAPLPAWMPPAAFGYALALFSTAAAVMLRLGLNPLWGDRLPYVFFYPAVMLSTLYGGLGAGILAMLLCALAALYFFLPPFGKVVLLEDPLISSSLVAYFVVSMALIALARKQRSARKGAEEHAEQLVRKEDELRQSEERFRALVDQAVVGIGQSDMQGRIEMVNDRFCQILGRTRGELLGVGVQEITHPDDRAINDSFFSGLIAGGPSYIIEKRYIRPDGSAVWVNNSVSIVRDRSGKPRGTVAVVQDINARKEQEEQLRRLNEELKEARDTAIEASQAKSAFLATMSHELRTPLNAVIGYAELVEEELHDIGQDHMAGDVDKIRVSGNHLLTLISDILDLSKIEAGKMELLREEFRVEDVVREAVDLVVPLLDRNSNGIAVECTGEVGKMSADRTRFRQILFNLLSNAAKFTEKGTIRIACRREADPDGKGWIVLSVADTGIGMSAEQIKLLFQKFQQLDAGFTRRHGGTGLGLAISQLLCRMMGGEITVQSEFERGSTFTVRLPVHAASGAQQLPAREMEVAAEG